MTKRVLIAYKYVPQYRAPFFEQLRQRLATDGIELALVYGDTTPQEASKRDAFSLSWAKYLPNTFVRLWGRYLIYQPFLRYSKQFDLVIVEQAHRLLINPVLLLLHRLKRRRVAYWGHGKNFQHGDSGAARWLKSLLARQVGWWFAYNQTSADVVASSGFPTERITRVMNTIDSRRLADDLASITTDEVQELRARLGISTRNVCIYIGGMYSLKRLQFLFDSLVLIRDRLPDFRMIFIGSGDDKSKVEAFAHAHPWCTCEGSRFGREKAAYMKLAKLLLMPGLVGLAVIDSFVAGLPIVTTAVEYHSPEIEYLESDENGVIVADVSSPAAYAEGVCDLLQDGDKLERLRAGCAAAAANYTMEQMVERFADGVKKALTA